MIAYRAEIWCQGKGCSAGMRDGTAHDDHTQLPGLARNLEEIYLKAGWTKDGNQHFCPKCSKKRRAS